MAQPDTFPLPAGRRAAFAALMANADRLLNDCDTLAAAGAYASAASLATLAFEESGRAYALRFDLTPSGEGVGPQKFHQAVAMVALSLAILRKYGIDDAALTDAVLPHAQAVTGADGSAASLEAMKTALEAVLGPIMAAQSSERNLELHADVKSLIALGRQVQAGEVGKVRSHGLQVETDATFAVLSDPATVARDLAQRWTWAAEGVFHLLRREGHHHPDNPEIAVLIGALGQDRPSV